MQFVDNFAERIFWAWQETLHFYKKSLHCDGLSTISNGYMLNARTTQLHFADMLTFVSKLLYQVRISIIN